MLLRKIMKLKLSFLMIALLIFICDGCSGNFSNPLTLDNHSFSNQGDFEKTIVDFSDSSISSTHLMSAYNLLIDPDKMTAELTRMRDSSLGESFIISGESYFTTYPCLECLKIANIGLDSDENIIIEFTISHPFEKGNVSLPQSGKNRLDLDIFDVALLVEPVNNTPTRYELTDADIYTNVIKNPSGCSGDLGVILPYVICFESSNNNRFEMGTKNNPFSVTFLKPGLAFNLYLTMGYGSSATFAQRLNPVYYVPEFNRKSPWKIDITAPIWDSNEPETVVIDIFDWNHGAEISPGFPDETNPDHISASSDISKVTVEVPGMTDDIVVATTTDSETNGWDDPITYTAAFSNENNLAEGDYIGLVKVTDSRTPGTAGGTDSLIISPDGKTLDYREIPEFASYQTFTAKISTMHFTVTWGGTEWDMTDCVVTDNDGNIYIAGDFSGTVDFDAGTGEDIHTAHGSWPDAFALKLDQSGNFIWAKCWGLSDWDSSVELVLDDSNNVYITGLFQSIVDFDPGPNSYYKNSKGHEDIFVLKLDTNGNFSWVLTWGGIFSDYPFDIALSDSNIYTTGFYMDKVDFNTDSGIDEHTAADDSEDIFISKHDTNGNFIWARTLGGTGWDTGISTSIGEADNVYLAGSFQETVDFDPGLNEDFHTAIEYDAFISKFNPDGDFIWARTWGAENWDESYDVIHDGNEYLYVSGIYDGVVDFNPGPGEDWHTSIGEDAFMSKFTNSGDFVWAVTWGGDDMQCGYAMAFDSIGNILVSGDYMGTSDFDPGTGITQYTSQGENDIYVSKFDNEGNFQWVHTWGGVGSDGGWGVAVDNRDNVLVTGAFREEVDFNLGFGQDLRTSNGDYDCFVLKFLLY